jgi:hypothetical protein
MTAIHVKSTDPSSDAQAARILNTHPDGVLDLGEGRVLVFHVTPKEAKKAISSLKLFSRKVEIVESDAILFS